MPYGSSVGSEPVIAACAPLKSTWCSTDTDSAHFVDPILVTQSEYVTRMAWRLISICISRESETSGE